MGRGDECGARRPLKKYSGACLDATARGLERGVDPTCPSGGTTAGRAISGRVRTAVIGAAAALVLAVGASPAQLGAQAPNEAWRTITTEHFRVTFPERLESLGRKAADRSERAWTQLSEFFVDPPDGMIDVVVTDHSDVSNGFASITPSNRIVVFARPPVDQLSIGYSDEWMELVITHELAHIVHLDLVRNPIGIAARAVFGRVSMEWPFFPETGTPTWVTEGLATWYESRLTDAGRVHGTFNEMQLRTAVLEGRFENIGQASGSSPLWPGGNRPYAYGSLFFDFMLDRYGEDTMIAFVDAIGGQWVPYRIDAAGRHAFGVSLTDEWQIWREGLEADLRDLDERLAATAPVTEAERLTTGARWGLYPTPSPDGRWIAYTRADGRSDTQLRVRDVTTGESRSIGRTNALSTFAWTPDNRILLSQMEFKDPYRSYADLYLRDLYGGERRLTRAARLTQPSTSPDGAFAVAVGEGDGTNRLVRVDLTSGAVGTLVEPDAEVHWAFPRWSPNGRWIAATRWEPNANHDVVVLDAATGAVLDRVTADRALDVAPAWSPDSRWLVWSSDRTGVLNVLGAEIDPASGRAGDPLLLTNVRTGAGYPAVDPSGSWLYFSGYHVDGWDIERVAFDPEHAVTAPPASERFAATRTPPDRGSSGARLENYSPLPTLGPTYWEVAYQAPIETPELRAGDTVLPRRELLGFSVGAQTGGRDLVGRHAWAAAGRISVSGAKFQGGAAYSFSGFAPYILSLSAAQGYSDGGQFLAGDMDQDTLLVLDRERSLTGSATYLFPKWRRNVSFTLSGGLVWETRELLDETLQPSSGYTLNRPTARLADVSASLNVSTSRSHSFQMGTARGMSVFLLGRLRNELTLPDSLTGVGGVDRSFGEVFGRVRGALPLWGGGYATHVLAVQAVAGVSSGPGAGPGQYRVGGASGRPETLTGGELFGGNFLPFPLRGYETSSRFGRYAWSASAEYRFPLWLINRGLRAWPVHLDRAIGSIFFDAGNAWGPDVTTTGFQNPLRATLASVGAEVTTEVLGLYDVRLRLRGGVGVPLIEGTGVRAWFRVGLPF
jgi:WD40-like Beta Propeller Repeat